MIQTVGPTCIKLKKTISEIKFEQPLFAVKVFEVALPHRPAMSSVQSPQVYTDEIDPTSVKDVPSIVKYIYNPLTAGYQSFQYKFGYEDKELERFMTHSL